MKLLLDKQMLRKFASRFPEYVTVVNVQLKGREGIKSGELLKRAAADGYDALISGD